MIPPGEARWLEAPEHNDGIPTVCSGRIRLDSSLVKMEYDALGRNGKNLKDRLPATFGCNVILHEWKYSLNFRQSSSLTIAAL
jgi:hypothetical protein